MTNNNSNQSPKQGDSNAPANAPVKKDESKPAEAVTGAPKSTSDKR